MAAHAIALNEIEWRADATSANAGRAISSIKSHASLGLRHVSLLKSITDLSNCSRDVVAVMHKECSVSALECATREERAKLGEKLVSGCDKVRILIVSIRNASIGKHWMKFYEPKLRALQIANEAMIVHCHALRDQDSALLVLSDKDERFILDAVLNPKEPSEELYRLFARK